jgi:hypothetical protein
MGYKQIGNQNFGDQTTITFEEKGQTFEGTLRGLREVTMSDERVVTIADFTGMDQEDYAIFLGAKLSQIINQDLIGQQMRITFLGKVKNPRTSRWFNDFEVELWEDDSAA